MRCGTDGHKSGHTAPGEKRECEVRGFKKLHLLVVLGLLHLLHLVNASLAGSSNTREIHSNIVAALTVDPGRQGSVGGVEGEGVDEGLAAPLGVAPQLAGAQHALRPHHHQEKKLK